MVDRKAECRLFLLLLQNWVLSVPYKGVGRCLGPEGNGVSSGEGGKGGPGPQTEDEISSLATARKEATWSRKKSQV
jgi:hypothetical protein